MSTVRDLLKSSMRLLGTIATGETPSNEELTDGLSSLNGMLSGWSTEPLLIYGRVREEFSMVPGTGSYTIGTTGVFVTARPQQIEDAKIEIQTSTPNYETHVEILNEQQWADITVKDQTAGVPTKLYVEEGFPNSTIYLWPKPTSTDKLVLYSWKPLSSFSTLDDLIAWPPGLERTVKYNLAIEWAPEFGKTPSAEVVAIAMESKENFKRLNTKPQYLGVDAALTGGKPFNIYSGE